MFTNTPDPDWLKNPSSEGDEAQWLKERSQANRQKRLARPQMTRASAFPHRLPPSPIICAMGCLVKSVG